jgi:hypothetical protein
MTRIVLGGLAAAAILAMATLSVPAGATEKSQSGIEKAQAGEVSSARRHRRAYRAPRHYRYAYPRPYYSYGYYRPYRYYAPAPYPVLPFALAPFFW